MNNDPWDEAITQLACQVMNKPKDPALEQTRPCPVCGNPLVIQVGSYQRGTLRMIGVTIECHTCNQASAIDAIEGDTASREAIE